MDSTSVNIAEQLPQVISAVTVIASFLSLVAGIFGAKIHSWKKSKNNR